MDEGRSNVGPSLKISFVNFLKFFDIKKDKNRVGTLLNHNENGAPSPRNAFSLPDWIRKIPLFSKALREYLNDFPEVRQNSFF